MTAITRQMIPAPEAKQETNPLPASDIPDPTSPSGFPPFMRSAELAERLRLKPKTLAEYRSSGEGPEYIKAGPRLCIYTAAAVEAWLQKNRRASTSSPA